MALRELITRFGFEVDDKPLREMEAAIGDLKSGFIGLGATIGVAVGSLYGFVKTTADAGDEALATATTLGISVEALQELGYAAQLSDVSVEQFRGSLQYFSKTIGDAKMGSKEAADEFKVINGLLGRDLIKSGASVDQMMVGVADAFSKMTDQSKKAIIASKLFGRAGGISMVNFLSKGSAAIGELRAEAESMGAVLSTEAAQAGDDFNDAMTRAKTAVIGIKNQIGVALMPQVQALVDGFREWIMANRQLIKQNLGGILKGMSKFMSQIGKAISVVTKALTGLAEGFGGAERVTYGFLAAVALLSGASILAGIGRVVQTVFTLARALTLANASAIAIPLAIGAAVLAVGLIIEDIVAFFQGRDSFTGKIVEYFKSEFPNLTKFLVGLFDTVRFAIIAVIGVFKLLISWVQDAVKWVMAFLGPVGEFIDSIVKKFNALGLGGVLGKIGEKLSATFGGFSMADADAALGVNKPASVPGTVTNNSTTNAGVRDVSTTINVSVPEGLSPGAAASSVERGVSGGLEEILRQATRANAPGVAY